MLVVKSQEVEDVKIHTIFFLRRRKPWCLLFSIIWAVFWVNNLGASLQDYSTVSVVAPSKDVSQHPLPSNFRLSLLDVPQVTRRSRKKKKQTRCVFPSSSTVPQVALSPSWVPQIWSVLQALGIVSTCPVGTSFGCQQLLDSLTVPCSERQNQNVPICFTTIGLMFDPGF